VRDQGTTPHVRRGQRGATTVEFAVVLPLLVLVMFGVIDGGRLIASRVMLTYAVSKGARVASLSPDSTPSESTVQAAVTAAAPLLNPLTNFTVTTYQGMGLAMRPSFADRVAGDKVQVHARYVFRAAFIPSFTKTLQQTSWVVVE
jgi:Flp pilus assembly protein TadG